MQNYKVTYLSGGRIREVELEAHSKKNLMDNLVELGIYHIVEVEEK